MIDFRSDTGIFIPGGAVKCPAQMEDRMTTTPAANRLENLWDDAKAASMSALLNWPQPKAGSKTPINNGATRPIIGETL